MKRKILIGRMFYGALTDEVAIFDEAQRLGTITTKDELRKLNGQKGIATATAVLYQYLLKKHKTFISQIDGINVSDVLPQIKTPIKLLVVPGMFYSEHSEIGADGALISSIGAKYGLTSELVHLKSRGSVTENIRTLEDVVRSETHERVWIVSFSKGSTETRLCLERLNAGKFPSNIKGWVSISGMTKGTPHADNKLRSFWSRVLWLLTKLVLSVDPKVTGEIAVGNKSLLQPLGLPAKLPIIHVVGVPLPSHVHTPLYKRYMQLEALGPNDGIILLEEFLELPGHVYPIWGADHFLRSTKMSELIHRLCIFIRMC